MVDSLKAIKGLRFPFLCALMLLTQVSSCFKSSYSWCYVSFVIANESEELIYVETSFPRGYSELHYINHNQDTFDNRPAETLVKPGETKSLFCDSYRRDHDDLLVNEKARDWLFKRYPDGYVFVYNAIWNKEVSSYEKDELMGAYKMSEVKTEIKEYRGRPGLAATDIIIRWKSDCEKE